MRVFVSVIIMLLFIQCHVENKTIKINDVVPTDTLISRSIDINENILMPTKIFAIEDKLVIFDHTKNDIFKVFKLPNLEFIFSYGNIGKGPDEFSSIDPNSMKKIDNKLCFLDNHTIKWLSVGNDKMAITKSKIIRIEQAPTNRLLLLNDSIYLADAFYGDKIKDEFQLINLNKKKVIRQFGDFPNEKIDFKNEIEKYLAYMKASASNLNNDKFISFYLYFNRLKIFNNSGRLLKEVVVNSNHSKFKPDERNNNIIYRVEPYTTDEFIYVLNIEQSKKDFESEISTFMPKLEIWNWQGELLDKYFLDKPIIAFTISEDNSKLYGTSILKMNEIYEFDLPKQLIASSGSENEFKEVENNYYKINIPSTWIYSTSTPIENKNVVQNCKAGICNTNIFVNSKRIDRCGTSMWVEIISNDRDLRLNDYVESRDSIFKHISDDYKNRIETIDDKPVIYSNFTISDKHPNGEKFTANTAMWTWIKDGTIIEIKFTSCSEFDKSFGIVLECISSFKLKKNLNLKL